MCCFRQKRMRPPFNSGWTLLLRINCTYDKCIIWNTVTKYVIVWRFLCEKWKQIKYLTTSLSTFSVLSMFMYDSFLFHINQYSKLYNHKHFGFLDKMEYDNLLTILDDVRTEYFVDVTLFKVNEFDWIWHWRLFACLKH